MGLWIFHDGGGVVENPSNSVSRFRSENQKMFSEACQNHYESTSVDFPLGSIIIMRLPEVIKDQI